MSIETTLQQIADVTREVTGIERVYAAGDIGKDGLVDAITETPAVIVYPQRSIEPAQGMNAWQEHRYRVGLLVLATRSDSPSAANRALPMVDRILDILARNVRLGGGIELANVDEWQFGAFTYANTEYLGYQISVRIHESKQQEYRP